MAFNSVQYFLFLAVVVAIYWATPPKYRPHLIVAASFFFYGTIVWWYDLILLFTIVVAYAAALVLPRLRRGQQSVLLWSTSILLLGIIAGFKYVGAFNLGTVAGPFLPAGLSWYTFNSISYMVDVRRGNHEPERRFVIVAAFVSFFPHLLAGPIVRAKQLMPQLSRERTALKRRQASEALELIMVGLFKKVAVADILLPTTRDYQQQLALQGTALGSGTIILVLMLVGGYFDIAGYIDIARGSAKLMGIELPRQFMQPLTRSRDFTDFWRRWQITLMTFLRDYVYMPLRGRTRSTGRAMVAVTIVFVAISIWHGINVGFALFGLVISGLFTLERRFRNLMAKRRRGGKRSPARKRLNRLGGIAWVWFCLFVTMGFLMSSFSGQPLSQWLRPENLTWGNIDFSLGVIFVYAIAMLVLLDGFERRQIKREGRTSHLTWARAGAFAAMGVLIVVSSGAAGRDFIYPGF